MSNTPEPEAPQHRRKMKRYCNGKNSRGKPCDRAPIRGGTVCPKHGGGFPQVRAAANRRIAESIADIVDPDRALREAARLAYSDVRQIFDEKGRLKPIKDWPDELAAAVGGVEVVKRNVDSGDGKTDDVIKIKVWDKPKALEMLFKHLGLLEESLNVKLSGAVDLEARLVNGRKRVADARKRTR